MSLHKPIIEFDAVIDSAKTIRIPADIPNGKAHITISMAAEGEGSGQGILELLDRWEKERDPAEPRRTKEEIDDYIRRMRDEWN
ncbi:hypothetical protein IT571_01695 [Candidatus Sumerlaeota bacterium]|nr:hypothetical protein [Candidatus Sumerlaeota bacterium]